MIKVMIVDDSRIFRKMLRAAFIETGNEVIGEAGNGQEALELLKSCKPDLLTLDITMPVLDGLDALKEIKKVDANAKVIMVTAAGQQNKMVDAIKSGASEFVTKPFESEVILDMVNKVSK